MFLLYRTSRTLLMSRCTSPFWLKTKVRILEVGTPCAVCRRRYFPGQTADPGFSKHVISEKSPICVVFRVCPPVQHAFRWGIPPRSVKSWGNSPREGAGRRSRGEFPHELHFAGEFPTGGGLATWSATATPLTTPP